MKGCKCCIKSDEQEDFFCEIKKIRGPIQDIEIMTAAFVCDNGFLGVHVAVNGTYVVVENGKVNYCPMCGRKLGKGKNG